MKGITGLTVLMVALFAAICLTGCCVPCCPPAACRSACSPPMAPPLAAMPPNRYSEDMHPVYSKSGVPFLVPNSSMTEFIGATPLVP